MHSPVRVHFLPVYYQNGHRSGYFWFAACGLSYCEGEEEWGRLYWRPFPARCGASKSWNPDADVDRGHLLGYSKLTVILHVLCLHSCWHCCALKILFLRVEQESAWAYVKCRGSHRNAWKTSNVWISIHSSEVHCSPFAYSSKGGEQHTGTVWAKGKWPTTFLHYVRKGSLAAFHKGMFT